MFTRLLCVSIAVPNIEEALPAFTEKLGLKLMGEIRHGVRGYGLRYVELGDGNHNFLELVDSPQPGPVQKFLERRGPGVYQIRLETDNLYETAKSLREQGVEVILAPPEGGGPPPTEPDPEISLAFVHPRSSYGVLIELFPPSQ